MMIYGSVGHRETKVLPVGLLLSNVASVSKQVAIVPGFIKSKFQL